MRYLVSIVAPAVAIMMTAAPAAAQDAALGEKAYSKCRSCHQMGENAKSFAGPTLNGLFGRKAGTLAGYSYSEANKKSDLTWSEETFKDYIKDPRAKMPGTKMVFAGVKDEREIADLIAYLKQFAADGKQTK